MAGGDVAEHKFALTPARGGTSESVDLSCSCGWESRPYSYREPAKIAAAKQFHIVAVLAARAGVAVEW